MNNSLNIDKMGSTSETDFVWVKELKAAFARSFPGDYQLVTFQRFQRCVEEEMQSSSDRKRLLLLFETLLDFYSHFCWKIKFKEPSEMMKEGLIQLLANLIKVGLTVKYEARLRTVLTVLTDKEDLLYSALLLVTHLKKKSQESYGVLLGDILCSRPLNPSTPETYLKIILLLRRLQLLTRKKPRQLASPPIHTVSWLRLHCPKALPKNPKPHILTNHLLQKKLPSDVLKDLREVLFSFDDKPCSEPLEKIQNEEGFESREDAFIIDSSGDPSSHQDLSQLFVETSVSKKKKRKSGLSNEDELKKETHLEEFDKKVSQKKSKKHNHLHEIEGSEENDGSNLLNGVEEVLESPDCNTEETKSKKKRRKSRKEKDSTPQLCDQVYENSPFENKIRSDKETKINVDVSILNESEDINEESFEKEISNKEDMNVSSRKRRHKSDKGKSSPNISVTTEKDCGSLSSSKKLKMSKRVELSTSKEESNDQSCNLSVLSDSVADNGNLNKPIESSCVSSESHCLANSSQELLDQEGDAIEERDVHQSLKKKKNNLELQSSNFVETSKLVNSNKSNTEVSPSDIVQLAGECFEKDTVMENMSVQEKQVIKTPKKSRKSLLKKKNKNSKSQSDPLQGVEEKAANKMVTTENEEQLLETSSKMKTKDPEVTNEAQKKDSENSVPNLLGIKDFEDPNNDIKVSLECETNISTECESTNAEYKDQSVLLENSVSVGNYEEKNQCKSPRKNTFNSEKEVITDNHEFSCTDGSSDQKTNKLPSIDVEIKGNAPKLTEESGDNHCDETDVPVVPQISSSLQKETDETISIISMKEEDSAMETACLGSNILSPTNLIQKLKEECLNELALCETSKDSNNMQANDSKKLDLDDSFKIENQSEEISESKIKGIRVSWRPSLEDSETILSDSIDPKEEDDVKSEEENYEEQVGIEGDRQVEGSVRRVRVYPQIIKKNEDLNEESKQSILVNSSECSAVQSSDSKELIRAHTDTNVRNKVDHEGQDRSMNKSESKNRLLNVQCSENSTNKVSVKCQSSDSEMSLKEAIMSEYEEELAENTGTKNVQIPETSKSTLQSSKCVVKSDSDESCTESLELDKNVEELSKNLMITSGKQMPKTKTYIKKSNDKHRSIDSDESISSLNLEDEESSSKLSALERRSTRLSRNKSVNKKKIDVESKSLTPEHKSQESFCADKIVEEGSINNKSNEEDLLFTPRKSKRLDAGKHPVGDNSQSLDMAKNPRKLLVSSPDSIKIQNVFSAVNDKSIINSMVLSGDKNEGNPDSKAKSCVERKTRSRRMLGAEKVPNATKNCSVVLVDILGSAGELADIVKEELSTTDEEPMWKGFQESKLSSTKKDTDLSSSNEKTKWTLSYESDSSIESDDSDKRHTKGKVSHSKNLSKTVKPSSDLNPVNKLTKPSEPEQDTEVGSRRYNLRRSCKTFPNVKQPSSQKLAAVPRMTFSPLIRKAADYPEFSDVSLSEDRLGSIQEEIFNDEYRESPADLTVIEPVDKMEDETSSIGDESPSLPTEPENMSQPIVSKDNSEHMSSENSSDMESSQGISENGDEEASQPMKSENTDDPEKSSKSNSSSAEPILRISKSRLKAGSSSRRQQPARGYSLRSKGAAVGLELNLEKLSIGTPQKKVNSKDAKKDTKSAEDHCNLRRSKRNVVLPGKLKL